MCETPFPDQPSRLQAMQHSAGPAHHNDLELCERNAHEWHKSANDGDDDSSKKTISDPNGGVISLG